jgi:hypothetical protein
MEEPPTAVFCMSDITALGVLRSTVRLKRGTHGRPRRSLAVLRTDGPGACGWVSLRAIRGWLRLHLETDTASPAIEGLPYSPATILDSELEPRDDSPAF